MPIAGILTEITDSVTSLIGDYGLYAVFVLMMIDAVFPAASEVVMVYAGAVAAGAFAGQSVTFLGIHFEDGAPAYVAMALAGSTRIPRRRDRRVVDRSPRRKTVPRASREMVPPRFDEARPRRDLV